MDQKTYRTIRMKNSILNPGKEFEVSFTKKQYRTYLLKSIAWWRVAKLILILAGLVGLWVYNPLFLICGLICLVIDLCAFLTKRLSWYFIFVFLLGYLIIQSWEGLIFASFLIGILNYFFNKNFSNRHGVDITKLESVSNKEL